MTNSSDAFETSSPSGLPEGSDRVTEDGLIEAIPHRPINMAAGTIGHFVEWYDWYIYGLLAAVFAGQIFPSHSPFASLIAALLTYAIGFVIRPFSGIIISPLADRFGRRAVLALSISGMAVGSLIVGLTPSFATIGYAAPILFVIARILQGISAGSEQQSAISFMVEHAPANRRGLFGSFSNMASGLATLAATGSAAIVTAALPPDALAAWGWRIPFLVGGILGLVGLLLRARADETPEFEAQAVVDKKSAPARLWALLRTPEGSAADSGAVRPGRGLLHLGDVPAHLCPPDHLPGHGLHPDRQRYRARPARHHRANLRCPVGSTWSTQDFSHHRCHRHDRALLPPAAAAEPAGIRRIRPGCGLRMGGHRYLAGGLPDHSGRAVPGLGPGIRHWFLASAGDRHLRWHRPADRRRVRRRRTSHLGRHLHDRHRRPLSHRLLHAPRDGQQDPAGHRSPG